MAWEAMRALAEPEEDNSMYPLGLRGDGVPVKGRKNQSTLDYWTINFASSRKNGHTRFLTCCLDQQFSLGQETYQEIMKVITWSLKQLAFGQRACRRHDGKKLDKTGKQRLGQAWRRQLWSSWGVTGTVAPPTTIPTWVCAGFAKLHHLLGKPKA